MCHGEFGVERIQPMYLYMSFYLRRGLEVTCLRRAISGGGGAGSSNPLRVDGTVAGCPPSSVVCMDLYLSKTSWGASAIEPLKRYTWAFEVHRIHVWSAIPALRGGMGCFAGCQGTVLERNTDRESKGQGLAHVCTKRGACVVNLFQPDSRNGKAQDTYTVYRHILDSR